MTPHASHIAHALIVVVVSAGAALAQDVGRMEQVIQSMTPGNRFMGAVLVARGENILLSKGYGSANLEWEVANSPASKFRIGSVTKQFTAAAILLLEERGRLSVDDPVRKHLADAPAAWQDVTIFHLLTHTSGIPSFTGFPDYQSTMALPVTIEKLVERFRDKPLEFKPGDRMNYSNSGYVLLGHLIEKISGKSYAQFLQENIFTPLGMTGSGYDSNAVVIAYRASGYGPGPNGPVNAPFLHMTIPHGAGALYSTTEDLLRWNQALYGGKLLTAASLKRMTTPVKNDYGFGLVITTSNGRTTFSHSGGINGFNSYLAYYPESRVTVAVLANINGPGADDLGGKLSALAHGQPVVLPTERKEITLTTQVLARYVGTYQLAPGTDLTIRLDGSQLIAQLGGQKPLPIFPESETRFFLRAVDAQLDFVRDDKGAVTHAILHQNGRETKAARASTP
jgi:CubicO group peptidase (beta-lactamase class C family)